MRQPLWVFGAGVRASFVANRFTINARVSLSLIVFVCRKDIYKCYYLYDFLTLPPPF